MKTAVLIGSSGNLGPIWHSQLEVMGYEVFCMDMELGYNVQRDIDFSLFDAEVLEGRTPSLILYNAALDHPTRDGVHFFKDYKKIIDTNLVGPFRAAEKWLPKMAEKGEGLFIGVSSIQARIASNWRNYEKGIRKPGGYNASKAGLEQLIRSLASEYGREGVRACGMAFGAVDTGKLPGEPFRARFLDCLPLQRFISEQSLRATLHYIIDCPELTGQTILVDSGYTVW